MKKKTIITISRQFGSGGREVGQKLAEQLGIPFYDKELIEIAARESGLDKELFEDEETRTSKGFHLLGALGYSLGGPLSTMTELSLNDRLFIVQSQVVKQVADEGPCIIVGRCADYVLRDREDVLHVFIHADMEDRKNRAVHSYEVDERDIEASVRKIDKRRSNYYEYYTDRKWGKADNYDVSINTSTFGIDRTVSILKDMLEKKEI
ncbi:AAA family ATPase [[Eubacterium] hominis]|uniref:cytidylate kinase-like family protein n=1 Tax=[Eubacterium] hominis TaxID=2764325 RepID=UPI003A4E3B45